MNDLQLEADESGTEPDNAAEIRRLNDAFRQSFTGGRVTLTAGFGALPDRVRGAVIAAVRSFTCFDLDDNDPYGEHDFGVVDVGEVRVFWKIDNYDRSLRLHSPDAADPNVTIRILTILCADEY